MLPYASYLRVYEPLAALDQATRESVREDLQSSTDTTNTLTTEQSTVLRRAVSSAALGDDQGAGTYVMRVAGRSFYCPSDMPLRSWLSLTALVSSGDANAQLLFAPESIAVADENFLSWRRQNPQAVPHIRQTTWGVPRTWFLLVRDRERELYDAGPFDSIRYRAKVIDARRRVITSHAVLEQVIDDADLSAELIDLGGWLDSFDPAGWVELDYAGVAQYLGDQLDDDHSADDVSRALTALRQGDWPTAGATYRAFEERWRGVNGYERAN
ncbi:MAG: hypothetical protein H0T17_07095 [Propionibacteriales bacterium]|nr:hypothetical protein [Propionibacteriales bacterium]